VEQASDVRDRTNLTDGVKRKGLSRSSGARTISIPAARWADPQAMVFRSHAHRKRGGLSNKVRSAAPAERQEQPWPHLTGLQRGKRTT